MFRDTWTRFTRWFCEKCGAINPNITGTCIRCGS
jgi:ribosomal protein L40E